MTLQSSGCFEVHSNSWLSDLEVGKATEVQHLEHFLCVWIHLDELLVKSRDVWDVVVPPLSLLLLQLDGDSSDWTALDPLHQVSHIPCDLVAQRFAGDDGDLLAHPLVDVEVIAQARVVLLDDDPRGLLDRLGPDSTHC